MTETSFGEYFDTQRDRLRKMLDNKNAQQNIEWMEEYEKRQQAKKINEGKPQPRNNRTNDR